MRNFHLFCLAAVYSPLILVAHGASAQTSASNEPVRPSADAWNSAHYGAIAPTLYTGTLHLSVPLYTYSDPDFEIPISAEYATNGCLPNDKAGSLGVGWTLSAGGSITREIRGVPDDKRVSRNISASYIGYVKGFGLFYQSIASRYSMIDMPVSGLGFSGRSCVYYRLSDWQNEMYDAEPDIFHFNFMGYSGSFQLDFGGVIHIYDSNMPPESFKIETGFSLYNGSPISITTSDGYRYEFDGYYGYPNVNTEVSYDSGTGTILTWKLSRIIAPNGRKVQFGYTSGSDVRTVRPNSLCYNLGFYGPSYTDSQQYSEQKGRSDNQITTANLTSITIDGGALISFSYEYVIEKNYINSNEEPSRYFTSFGNDLLKSLAVSYGSRTVSSCSFVYDNANPAGRNYLTSITKSGEGTYSMQYLNTSSIPMYCTYKIDHWGYYNGKYGNAFLEVSTLYNDTMDENLNPSSIRTPDAAYSIYGTLSRITYPTGGYSTFSYEAHTYGKKMGRLYSNDYWPTPVSENGTAGGVRIKRIQHYDRNGTSLDWREYQYTEDNARTGILVWIPRYRIYYSTTDPTGTEEFGTILSNNFSHCCSTHIEYSSVLETCPDGSAIRHRYTSSLDYPDQLIYENGNPEKYFGVYASGLPYVYEWSDRTLDISKIFPLTSRQSLRGKEAATEMLDASGSIVASTENSFTNVLPNVDWIYTPQYLLHYTMDIGEYIGREDVGTHSESLKYGSLDVSTDETYSYNTMAQRISRTATGSRGEEQTTDWTYVSNYSSAPDTSIYRKMYNAGQVDRLVSESVSAGTVGLVTSRTLTYIRPDETNHPNLFCIGSVTEHDGLTERDYVTSYTYDHTGRILQKTDPAGLNTAYVWGYGGLYPLAEIVGASLDQVKAIPSLSGIETAPLAGALAGDQASALRNLGDATIWEYEPLIGLTKETTPDGRSSSFTYNASGKLHQILDDLGCKTSAYLYSPDNRQ